MPLASKLGNVAVCFLFVLGATLGGNRELEGLKRKLI